jgi:hypothetical protein
MSSNFASYPEEPGSYLAVAAAFIHGAPEYLRSNQATTASTIFLFIIHKLSCPSYASDNIVT